MLDHSLIAYQENNIILTKNPLLSSVLLSSFWDTTFCWFLFRCWHKEKPRSFTLKTLLTLLHRLNLRKMEMWIRIITSRHYQHIRQEILNRRGSSGHTNSWILSENSPIMLHPGSLLNISQDSGVSDMECSYTTHNATYTSHTDTDNNDYYDMQDSLLSPR